MSVFVAVAEAGSLSAAARKLGRPLTTISRQLAALEDHLGASLIARNTRRLALTEAGRHYLDTCRRVMEDLASAESDLSGRSDRLRGELSITAPVVFGRLHVLPIVARFLRLHPEVDARLLLVDRVIDLAEEGVDVAVRIGALPDSSLVATRVGTVRFVTCAAPAYLHAHGAPGKPADLRGHACITFSNLAGGRQWVFNSRSRGRRSVRVAPRLAVTTAEAAIDAAVAGLGITRLLSYQAADALRRKKLVSLLDDCDDADIPVQVVRRETRRPNAQTRAFVDFAVTGLRERLAGNRSAN